MLVRDDAARRSLEVLVVDDEVDVREVFRMALTRRGHHVRPAANGREALQAAAASHFDVAFIDIAMPDLDGVATLKELKALQPEVQAVMITGFMDTALSSDEREDRMAEAEAAGARGCLRKPFSTETIVRTAEYSTR